MIKKVSLKYFTGTGNSLRVLETCKNVFEENNFSVEISSITEEIEISKDCDIVGFCFPVYAFGLPRICKQYINHIPEQTKRRNTFLLVTCGDSDAVGFTLNDGIKLLKKKNYDVIYSEAVPMPANWITFINPPTKEEAQLIISNGLEKAGQIAQNIIEKMEYHHSFNIPKKLSKFGLYKEYYAFHKIGIYNMWRMFRTNEECNSCGLCARVCSTQSIVMVDGKPKWKSSCEQCMRCVNFCKQQAIFQTYGGNTEGKNRYIEPDFSERGIRALV